MWGSFILLLRTRGQCFGAVINHFGGIQREIYILMVQKDFNAKAQRTQRISMRTLRKSLLDLRLIKLYFIKKLLIITGKSLWQLEK